MEFPPARPASAQSAPLDPATPLSELPRIGPARSQALAQRNLHTLRDLLLFQPRRHQLWPEKTSIAAALQSGAERVRIQAKVKSSRLTRLPRRRSILRLSLVDDSGELEADYFNQPWLRELYPTGCEIEVVGQLRREPSVRLLAQHTGTLARPLPPPHSLRPLYPEIPSISATSFVQLILRNLESATLLQEPLPESWLAARALPPLPVAVREVHLPTSSELLAPARARLSLEPMLALQAHLARARSLRTGEARSIELDSTEFAELCASLPFALTPGQAAAIAELRNDLKATRPMRRLLQGDVGCGKTLVALWCALAVARRGGQSAFLAPTELLAEQHHAALAPHCEAAGVRIALLTASCSARRRKALLAEVAQGRIALLLGTHALLGKDVCFARLDLALVDEQQRFGVGQRLALTEKGLDVHLLLLTATPIPRTLAHTLYADLDVTTILDRPAGRGEVRTHWVRGEKRQAMLDFLGQRLAAGERAYWVCPRLDVDDDLEAEADAALSAERRFLELEQTPLAAHGLGLVHGRLESAERAARLAAFRGGALRLLVATSVIEVGVDVPEATVMVIEGAERFGLAQLHQLRGRIGRGPLDAWCFLLGKTAAAARFKCIEQERSGFVLAEHDLATRGMGDLSGWRQAGANEEGLGGREIDLNLFVAARDLLRAHPELAAHYAGNGQARHTP